MAVTKTEVVSARVPPDVKAALLTAAASERRSLATMLEVMILEYCKTHGVGTDREAWASTSPMGKRATRNGPRASTDKNN